MDGTERMHYFAYGSNMNEEQMKKRCPGSQFFGVGILRDYKLDFTISAPERWNGGGCADVVSAPNEDVFGLVYEVTQENQDGLDAAEGPRYRRINRLIEVVGGGKVEVFLYEVIDKAPFRKPSSQYLNIIKNAAEKYRFPETYIDFLNGIEVGK